MSVKLPISVVLTALLSLLIPTLMLRAEEKGAHQEHKHWSYDGETGPAHWAELGFLAEGVGKMQSPIDIPSKSVLCSKALELTYKASGLTVKNNGHAIQVNYDAGSVAVIDGQPYELLQFHFHSLSEHSVDGKLYDLELHLVHKNKDGGLAVIGVLFKVGAENKALQSIVEKLPLKAGDELTSDKQIQASELLHSDKSYWRYDGSLTTPPGTEGVKWHVMKQVLELSAEQLSMFKKAYSGNNRPVQPLNDRKFLE